eukprot:scpid56700/ scgid35639/ Putative aminopeptidase W07G4.4
MAQASQALPTVLASVSDLNSTDYDGIVLVTHSLDTLAESPALACLREPIAEAREIDHAVGKEPVVIAVPNVHCRRMVYSPTGPVDRDYDDVRRYSDAAVAGIKRALLAGFRAPLLVVPIGYPFAQAFVVSVLGALQALYVPLEVCEAMPKRAKKVSRLGIYSEDESAGIKVVNLVSGLESGRLIARDIGGSDPERMAAPLVADYVEQNFHGTPVHVNVISDPAEFEKHYPLFAAVNRCASHIKRHQGRIIELEYLGEGPTDLTLLLVGKGVTYDTGGADIKAGGVMAGMHRDKCGAAAVAGFFQILAALRPRRVKVVGAMACVRNSVGADSYVADEIITSRAGVRVRVGNTDAEGRMAMTDALAQMKERALKETNPFLMTIATLTGHAVKAVGAGYSIILDNGPAAGKHVSQTMQNAGNLMGDPFEISTLRREDYAMVAAPSEYEDTLQCNNQPSSLTPRGHQFPAAFMAVASGLDKHGINSAHPLPYSHLDIAGSSGPFPGIPSGSPIVALVAKFLIGRF